MKLKNPMLVVTDIDRSVEFYKKVFGLHIIMDFGANKTLTGGLALQTAETYKEFIGTSDILHCLFRAGSGSASCRPALLFRHRSARGTR